MYKKEIKNNLLFLQKGMENIIIMKIYGSKY